MTIEIIKKDFTTLKTELESIYKYEKGNTELDKEIDDESLKDLKNLLSHNELEKFIVKLKSPEYFATFNYATLVNLFELFELMFGETKRIKDIIDIEIFFKEGYQLDTDKLHRKYIRQKLNKDFPNFNLKRLAELYKYPPKTIKTYYDPEQLITIDEFVYRKHLIGIIQMIFNHMDLLICAVGPEGSGKSKQVSQQILMMYWTLKEIGIIEYKYEIKEMLFNTLTKFREAEDKYFDVPFRILGLDEGNELNRQDWREEEVRNFFQRLRRERYNRRIKFVSLPVLGELITNIILSRMNFIIDMTNKNELRTATLYKGDYDFYIIPRGNKIYSPFHKKDLLQVDIKNKLYVNLKDKEYLKGMPKDILVKRCTSNPTWGFDMKEYEKELKESNKTFTVGKGLTFGLTELHMFYKGKVTLKKLGIKKGDIRYPSLQAMINKINSYFYNDPDLMAKYEEIYKRKQEDKDIKKMEDEEITSHNL